MRKSSLDILLLYPPGPPLHYQLSLPCLAGCLREKDLSVEILDLTLQEMSISELCEFVRTQKPKAIGVSIPFTNFAEAATDLLDVIRADFPDILLLCGGIHATLLPQEIAPHCDVVVLGEGDTAIVEIMEKRLSGSDIYDVRGVAYMRDDALAQTPPRPTPDLDTLPLPAWDLAPRDKYTMSLPFDRSSRAMPIFSSRGCPFNCSFCSNWKLSDRKVRWRNTDAVIEEMKLYVDKYHIDSVLFRDEVFTLDEKRVIEFCNRMLQKGLNLKWWCQTRAGTVSEDTLRIMKKAGCTSLSIGVESGNQEVLKSINKGITIERVKETLRLIKQAGLLSYAGFMVAHPAETPETIIETMRVADELDPDFVSYQIATPYPETELRKAAEEQNSLLAVGWGAYQTSNVTYVPTGLKGYDISRIRKLAMLNFYGQSLSRISKLFRTQNRYARRNLIGLLNVFVLARLGRKYPTRLDAKSDREFKWGSGQVR